jgi:flagellin
VRISKVATGVGSTTPVVAGADAAFITAGGSSAAGANADTSANVAFTVDTFAVSLSSNVTNLGGLVTEIQNDLDGTAGAGVYNVTSSGGGVRISKVATGIGSTSPAIAGADAAFMTAGGTTANGANLVPTTNKSFTVDTFAVNLTTDVTNLAGLVTAIQTGLNTSAGAGVYSVSASGSGVQIAKVATGAGSTTPAIAGGDAAFITTGGSGVAGLAAGSPSSTTATSTGVNSAVTTATTLTLATGAFTVQIGTNTAVDVAGSYTSGQALADAINAQVAGGYASFDTTAHTLNIASNQDVTLAGTRAGAGASNLGYTTLSALATNGSMASVNVTSAANANLAMLRVDGALTSVSTLRSTLGAIQNRFQSTINSLQSVSENLSASRSRIQDTDFAAETAALTRVQILQQAGVAMVAQANAAPQNVLSLLRG